MVATELHVSGRTMETQRGKSSSRSRRPKKEEDNHGGDSVNEKLVEADDGDRRSSWREYHGNVGVWKDDRDTAVWKNVHEQRPVRRRPAASDAAVGPVLKSVMARTSTRAKCRLAKTHGRDTTEVWLRC